jgi:protein-disulfide isomerase
MASTAARKSELFQQVSTVVVVLTAVSLLGLRLYDRDQDRRRVRERTFSKVPVSEAFLEGGIRIGPAGAVLTIVEYADFECPVCKIASPLLDSILHENDGQVALLFKHFPMSYHSSARGAAVAAQCADEQGFFKEYASELWKATDRLKDAPWILLAEEAGIGDTAAFVSCLSNGSALARVVADSSSAAGLEIRGTPTLVVGGTRVTGLPAERTELRALVKSELASATRARKDR